MIKLLSEIIQLAEKWYIIKNELELQSFRIIYFGILERIFEFDDADQLTSQDVFQKNIKFLKILTTTNKRKQFS